MIFTSSKTSNFKVKEISDYSFLQFGAEFSPQSYKHYPPMTEKWYWVIGDGLLTLSSFLRLFTQKWTQRGTCWRHTLCSFHNANVIVFPDFRGKSSSNSYFPLLNMTNTFVKADILKCHQTCRVYRIFFHSIQKIYKENKFVSIQLICQIISQNTRSLQGSICLLKKSLVVRIKC